MDLFRSKLLEVSRPVLLRTLAAAIGELTIEGRGFYEPERFDRLRETNEAIHRVAGHLRDLTNPEEKLTLSRLDGIVEQLRLLPSSVIEDLFRKLG